MSADLLLRKETHFVLWHPKNTVPAPQLVIGEFQPGNPPTLGNERRLPLQPSAAFADVWEIAAVNCQLVEAKVYVCANALELPETGTTVRVKEGKRRVQDGPYADTKEQLAGFIILELPSVDAALEWAARCPGASIGAVEVRPLAPEAMRRGFTG